MKKLNRKGFTLVELLAVIVILAIVVGIAIPGVTGVINGAKQSALETALETSVDFLQDQYNVYTLIKNNADENFRNIYNRGKGTPKSATVTDAAELKALGFGENVAEATVSWNENVNAQTITFCVTVDKLASNSDYHTTTYWKSDGTPADAYATDKSHRRAGTC